MKCKYPDFFWPASKRRRYVKHCGNCRNSFADGCVLEIDEEGEVGQFLLRLAGAKDIRQAVHRIQRHTLLSLSWTGPESDRWLVEWDEREFGRWIRESHRRFLDSLRPEQRLLYEILLTPEEKWDYEWERSL